MLRTLYVCFVISAIWTITWITAQDTDNTHRPIHLSWAIEQKQGNRQYQEDRYDVYYPELSNIAVFAVYDGHGGPDMAHALAHGHYNVPRLARAIHDTFDPDDVISIKTTCENWEQQLHDSSSNTLLKQGSTATCVYCDLDKDKMYVFNVGDSRTLVILNEEQICATVDNTVKNEYHRVLDDGGTVTNGNMSFRQETSDRYRATPKTGSSYTVSPKLLKKHIEQIRCPRVSDMVSGSPSLIPSRAFGDYYGNAIQRMTGYTKKPQGVVVHPDAYGTFTLSQITGVILGTDGIWDTISHKEARQIMLQHYNHPQAAHKVAKHITHLARDNDNKTALVIIPKKS